MIHTHIYKISQYLVQVIMGEKPTFEASINYQMNCILQFGSIQRTFSSKVLSSYLLVTEEGTLRVIETAVYNSFDTVLVLQTLIFLPLHIFIVLTTYSFYSIWYCCSICIRCASILIRIDWIWFVFQRVFHLWIAFEWIRLPDSNFFVKFDTITVLLFFIFIIENNGQ